MAGTSVIHAKETLAQQDRREKCRESLSEETRKDEQMEKGRGR